MRPPIKLRITPRGAYGFIRSPTTTHYGADLGAPEGTVVVAPERLRVLDTAHDDNSPPPPDLARIRYVNAVSDNAAYDVFVGDTKQVSALAARTASIYFDVAPGTLVVTFRDPATGAVALTVPDVSLSNGSIRTIYATGTAGQMNSLPAIDR